MEVTLELNALANDTRGGAENKIQNDEEEESTEAAMKWKQQQHKNKMTNEDNNEEALQQILKESMSIRDAKLSAASRWDSRKGKNNSLWIHWLTLHLMPTYRYSSSTSIYKRLIHQRFNVGVYAQVCPSGHVSH